MNREDIIRMAREAGMEQDGDNFFSPSHEEIDVHITDLERFAALVEVHVNAREKERQRYDVHSCGPDCDRYICVAVRKARQEERNRTWTQEHWTEYERSIAAAEREAMVAEAAKLGWAMKNEDPFEDAVQEVAAIRARGNT